MPKETKMDYCTWTTNCHALRIDQGLEGCEKYRCCYTCPKKSRCEFPCKDRDLAPHVCTLLSSKEEAEARTAFLLNKFKPKELPKQPAKKVETKSEIDKLPSKKSNSKSKSLWEVSSESVPKSVKDLAIQTGSTYARANYLIKTKKLSFEQAFKILKG